METINRGKKKEKSRENEEKQSGEDRQGAFLLITKSRRHRRRKKKRQGGESFVQSYGRLFYWRGGAIQAFQKILISGENEWRIARGAGVLGKKRELTE